MQRSCRSDSTPDLNRQQRWLTQGKVKPLHASHIAFRFAEKPSVSDVESPAWMPKAPRLPPQYPPGLPYWLYAMAKKFAVGVVPAAA